MPESSPIVRITGIYNADGGLAGEVRYVVGHLLGMTECALCDVTHSPVRRKPEWDRMVSRFGIPIVVKHRNELDERLTDAIGGLALPVVFAQRADGSVDVAMDAAMLASLDGSVPRFEEALREALERGPRREMGWPTVSSPPKVDGQPSRTAPST